jgi:succinate-acetate transporter protein
MYCILCMCIYNVYGCIGVCEWGCFWGWRGAYLVGYLPARFAVFTNRRTRA